MSANLIDSTNFNTIHQCEQKREQNLVKHLVRSFLQNSRNHLHILTIDWKT